MKIANSSKKRERMNDFFRFFIDSVIGTAAFIFRFLLIVRMKTYYVRQAWLRRKYEINGSTPIHGYDEDTRNSIESAYRNLGSSSVYAYTSGSTNEPKKVPYDRRRLRRTRMVFIDALFRYLALLPKNRTLFIFSSFGTDQSLTALLMQERGFPPYFSGLQAPHRIQNHPAIQALAKTYGDTAVRFWILSIANPGMIYATNPSMIATFLHEIHENWDASRALIMDYINHPDKLSQRLDSIHARIASFGSGERLKTISANFEPLPLRELFPGLRGFACWDGGYVRPFIEEIRKYLPAQHYKHFPMYSMSTETIETIMAMNDDHTFFLPMATGVCYEFIEEGKEDISANVIRPAELIPGRLYSMLVTDAYGLKRYQTEDLFECSDLIQEIPNLHFVRRRNLSYSFTGEKLTAEQLELAFADVEARFPEIRQNGFLTCFPSKASEGCVPSYRLIYVQDNSIPMKNTSAISSYVAERLNVYNHEFKSKVESSRLGKITFESMPIRDFMQRLTGAKDSTNWGSQIKILPLYTKLWENFKIQ